LLVTKFRRVKTAPVIHRDMTFGTVASVLG